MVIEQDIYTFIQKHPDCTRRDIRRQFGIPERHVLHHTQTLISKELIEILNPVSKPLRYKATNSQKAKLDNDG
jgi:predicted ArsR family transcriptional regulator